MAPLEKQFHRREVDVSGQWKLLQWKFTACRYNIENANGFNTFSMSEGLSREDKEDLIRGAGSYAPPDHLPYQPKPEEIRELFPIVFSSFSLRSGKRAVVRTVYVGKDYAGVRWGNFFSHGLILPNGSPAFYPIRLWNSRLFADGLSVTELSLSNTPDPLPTLEAHEADLYDFSWDIPSFLSDTTERASTLFALIDSVRDGQTNGKPILLRDEPENIVRWIAAVQYALPLKLAAAISFTTYAKAQSTSHQFQMIGTSLEGNDFPFGSTSLNAINSVFDIPNGSIPKPSLRAKIFFDCIKTDEAPYPGDDLREIQRFADGIDCRLSDDSLDKSVLFYRFLQWNIVPKDRRMLQAIFEFYGSQPLPVRQKQTTTILAKDYLYDTETLSFLLPIMIKTIAESKMEPRIPERFHAFFVKQFAIDIKRLNPGHCSDRFAFLEIFVERYRDVAEHVFSHVRKRINEVSDRQKLAFLHYALLLCLYSRNDVDFLENAEHMPEWSNDEFRYLNDATLDLAVSKAFGPLIHREIIQQYTKRFGFSDDYATRYINLMNQRKQGENTRRYGMDRWKFGKPAEPQGTAFIDYVLNHAAPDEWAVWYAPFSFKPHQRISKLLWGTYRLWTIFDIDDRILNPEASATDKKTKWEYIATIRKMLETIVDKKNVYKLKILGLPTWLDIWKNTLFMVFCLAMLVFVSGATALLYYLGVFG